MKKVKLNMNEMPYSLPPDIIRAGQKGVSNINRYPAPQDQDLLKQLLADYAGVPKRNLIVYPGSDLILREIVHIFSKGRKMIMVYPTFFPTFFAAKQFANLITIPLNPPHFDLDLNHLLKELDEPSLVIIDNPNNPTGKILLDNEVVESVLDRKDVYFVVDEAYYEFTQVSFANLVLKYPNLAIGRTISKAFGLAGSRIGYIIGGEAFLEKFSLTSIMLPYAGLCAAIEAMKNPSYITKNIEMTIREKERVTRELEKMELQVYPSTTNFLLVNTKIADIGEKLAKKGIMVLDLSSKWRSGFIRVSIGTKYENDAFLTNINQIINH
ncbi:MAG: aminotransferase class I/II-fold pyridoxal phosphate-dependent enzyme [Candidatus Heimdallarchaeota archaeon]|nr:MAG: aminotransferase class I/II-fold pyridoxal phosphate-dependent enzyme [Candidatus Heimdallarchaeota archaeon]